MIWSIYEDQSKNLLLGMADGGVLNLMENRLISGFEKKYERSTMCISNSGLSDVTKV